MIANVMRSATAGNDVKAPDDVSSVGKGTPVEVGAVPLMPLVLLK
jgi:hypothetical protein